MGGVGGAWGWVGWVGVEVGWGLRLGGVWGVGGWGSWLGGSRLWTRFFDEMVTLGTSQMKAAESATIQLH